MQLEPSQGEPRQSIEIAAHAKAPVAGKLSRAIELRQAGELDRQPVAAIGRPAHRDAAPGIVARNRLGEGAVGIEGEAVGEFAPGPTGARGRSWADQVREFPGSDQETASGIDLPHKAQRVQARLERRLFEP